MMPSGNAEVALGKLEQAQGHYQEAATDPGKYEESRVKTVLV
jgi:hypothetical protein